MTETKLVETPKPPIRGLIFWVVIVLILVACFCHILLRESRQLTPEEQRFVGLWSYKEIGSDITRVKRQMEFRSDGTFHFPLSSGQKQSDPVVWHVQGGKLSCRTVRPKPLLDSLLDQLPINRMHIMRGEDSYSLDREIVWLNENSFQMGIIKGDTKEFVLTQVATRIQASTGTGQSAD